MLEIRNLSKVYKPKKGVPVTALDSVSLTFPERGMVFLLGKSGCGKSTMLNLLGGLDSYDSGEIIISGQSSRSFRQSDFDSYRNTLVGFIFQEYNVLEEFTVGANIALAIELQGRKATDEEINQILKEVDLVGFGARRPNELSGGQKQRVAIARALVKNPKIIMADEPTGALDSATGRQVLETLKRLSAEKLVIVVSHDREFAEKYADRIIELFDGRVVSDREFVREETAFEAAGLAYGEGEIRIPSGYRLTEEDRERINAYLAALEEGDDTVIRRAETARRQSRETVTPDLSRLSPIRFIKSRLPVKAAFRIGCGALKHKKIRLAFTIILSLIAFVLFGLADTFGAYDHVSTCARSIQDSAIHYVSLVRSEKIVRDEEEDDYYYRRAGGLSQDELEDIGVEYGVPVRGVFTPYRADLGFGNLFDRSSAKIDSYYGIYADRFNGFAAIDEETLREENLSLVCGRLPQGGKAEIAISTYVCETFERAGFARREGENTVYDPVTGPEDMLGKIFPLGGTDYTVVGVVSSGFNLERYRKLTELSEDETYAEIIVAFALRQELAGIQEYSLCQVALVGEERLEEMIRVEPKFENMVNGNLYLFENRPEDAELDEKQMIFGVWYGYPDSIGTLADQGLYEIEWVNGKKTELKGGEVVISADLLNNLLAFWSDVPEGFRDADLSKLTENEWTELKSWLSGLSSLQVNYYSWIADAYESEEPLDATVVGILMPDPSGKTPDPGAVILAADEIVLPIISDHRDGVYDFAVGAMPKEYDKVERIVGLSLREDTDVRFELQNPVTYELDVISGVLAELSRVFVVIGVFFAAFAAILLANFIGTSIAYKKQEIGILRAIGARSNDVFRIFFSESFVIAMTNFLLASAGTALTVFLINRGIRSSTGLLITVLSFTARQAALILGVSVLVAAVASFLPVKKIASKKPVDAIRGR